MGENEKIVRDYWVYLSEQKFHEAGALMAKNAIVKEPNTREIYVNAQDYVRLNEEYPGNWKASIEKLVSIDDLVISVVKLEDSEQQISMYATSFFIVKDELITELEQYWGDNGEPPDWRIEKSLAKRY